MCPTTATSTAPAARSQSHNILTTGAHTTRDRHTPARRHTQPQHHTGAPEHRSTTHGLPAAQAAPAAAPHPARHRWSFDTAASGQGATHRGHSPTGHDNPRPPPHPVTVHTDTPPAISPDSKLHSPPHATHTHCARSIEGAAACSENSERPRGLSTGCQARGRATTRSSACNVPCTRAQTCTHRRAVH